MYCIDNFESLELYGSPQSSFKFISTSLIQCKDKEYCKDENEILEFWNSYVVIYNYVYNKQIYQEDKYDESMILKYTAEEPLTISQN